MEKFKNKVAIVTGASAGIGANIVQMLLGHGVTVIGLARRKEKIEEIAKHQSYKGTLHALKCDVTKHEEVLDCFKWVEENVGAITILINNAGIASFSSVVDGDFQRWKNIFDTNFFGASLACKEAISQMTRNKIEGIIVNVNSIAGHEINDVPGFDMYIASKHALRALTELIRNHLRRNKSNIRISSVSPGPVDTDIWVTGEQFTKEEYENSFQKSGGYMNTEDVTRAVEYVLSNPPSVQVVDIILKPVGKNVEQLLENKE